MVNFRIYDITDWQQIMKIHILPNISRSEGNHAKNIGQLKNITWQIFSFENNAENKEARLAPGLAL